MPLPSHVIKKLQKTIYYIWKKLCSVSFLKWCHYIKWFSISFFWYSVSFVCILFLIFMKSFCYHFFLFFSFYNLCIIFQNQFPLTTAHGYVLFHLSTNVSTCPVWLLQRSWRAQVWNGAYWETTMYNVEKAFGIDDRKSRKQSLFS